MFEETDIILRALLRELAETLRYGTDLADDLNKDWPSTLEKIEEFNGEIQAVLELIKDRQKIRSGKETEDANTPTNLLNHD